MFTLWDNRKGFTDWHVKAIKKRFDLWVLMLIELRSNHVYMLNMLLICLESLLISWELKQRTKSNSWEINKTIVM